MCTHIMNMHVVTGMNLLLSSEMNKGVSFQMVAMLLAIEHFFWYWSGDSCQARSTLSSLGLVQHCLYQLGELQKNSIQVPVS